jgi:predicted transcriptional regulator YdeE
MDTKKLEEFSVAGLLHKSSMQNNTIPAFWEACFKDGKHEALHKADFATCHADYGVCIMLDDVNMDYIIGCKISDISKVPADYVTCALTGGEYAVLSTPVSKIGEAFDTIFKQIADAGRTPKEAPCFEKYDCECTDDHVCDNCKDGEMTCEIYVPIV